MGALVDKIMPFFWLIVVAGIVDIAVYHTMLNRAKLEYGSIREARSSARGTGRMAASAVTIVGILLIIKLYY